VYGFARAVVDESEDQSGSWFGVTERVGRSALDSLLEPGPRQDTHPFVLSLRCVECGIRRDDPAERWRIYFTDDEPAEPVTYCPNCARREFFD
jgi:ribosomal protein L44E